VARTGTIGARRACTVSMISVEPLVAEPSDLDVSSLARQP
jgi:hypothetical protein